jgi:hypothetical protein
MSDLHISNLQTSQNRITAERKHKSYFTSRIRTHPNDHFRSKGTAEKVETASQKPVLPSSLT